MNALRLTPRWRLQLPRGAPVVPSLRRFVCSATQGPLMPAPAACQWSRVSTPRPFQPKLRLARWFSGSSTGETDGAAGSSNKFLGRFDEVPLKDQRLAIQFTCTKCDTTSKHNMSRISFEKGVVIIRCPGCQNLHLIADHLGWFEDGPVTIEDIMAAKGETVRRLDDGSFESVAAEEEVKEHFISPLERAREKKLEKKRARQLEERKKQKMEEEKSETTAEDSKIL